MKVHCTLLFACLVALGCSDAALSDSTQRSFGGAGGMIAAAGSGGLRISPVGGQSGTGVLGASGNGASSDGGTASGGSAGMSLGGRGGASSGTGGKGGVGGGMSGGADAGQAGGTPSAAPTFVAVGYSGRRIRSTDLGMTWTDDQTLENNGGDDSDLLRAVAFGNGVFVAAGWKIFTSPDGKTWQEHTSKAVSQWLAGMVFQNGIFVAVGGYGTSARSADGMTWQNTGTVGNNQASRSLAFGMGMFVAAADSDQPNDPSKFWFESTDNGDTWKRLAGNQPDDQIAFCSGAFKPYASCSGAFNARGRATAAGVTIRLNDGALERSTNGADFTRASGTPQGLEDVTVGYVK